MQCRYRLGERVAIWRTGCHYLMSTTSFGWICLHRSDLRDARYAASSVHTQRNPAAQRGGREPPFRDHHSLTICFLRIDPLSTNGGMSLTQACEGDFAPAKLKIGKPDRNFALSAQKIQNSSQDFAFSARKLRIPCSNFAFSARKLPNSAQDFLFPRGKCQTPRSVSHFPCGKS